MSNSVNLWSCASLNVKVNRINRLLSSPPSHSLEPGIGWDRPPRKWLLMLLLRRRLCPVDFRMYLRLQRRCPRLGVSNCKWMRANRRRMFRSDWRMAQSVYSLSLATCLLWLIFVWYQQTGCKTQSRSHRWRYSWIHLGVSPASLSASGSVLIRSTQRTTWVAPLCHSNDVPQ